MQWQQTGPNRTKLSGSNIISHIASIAGNHIIGSSPGAGLEETYDMSGHSRALREPAISPAAHMAPQTQPVSYPVLITIANVTC